MKASDFPAEIRPHLIPQTAGDLIYKCLQCEEVFSIESLLYTCPQCKSVLLIEDRERERLKQYSGPFAKVGLGRWVLCWAA